MCELYKALVICILVTMPVPAELEVLAPLDEFCGLTMLLSLVAAINSNGQQIISTKPSYAMLATLEKPQPILRLASNALGGFMAPQLGPNLPVNSAPTTTATLWNVTRVGVRGVNYSPFWEADFTSTSSFSSNICQQHQPPPPFNVWQWWYNSSNSNEKKTGAWDESVSQDPSMFFFLH